MRTRAASFVWLGLCLCGAAGHAAAPHKPTNLADKIQKALDAAAGLQRGFLGIHIVDLATGEVVFENDSSLLYVPASNTKLFTAALGLTRLGPGFRFHTTVVAGSEADADGHIAGPLTLVGGGDPNLSVPDIEELARLVVERGVRRIDGDIVGDDSAYAWEPYPDGWGMGDLLFQYGAPVSALTVNNNAFVVQVQPGDPARITIEPPLEFYQIDNQVHEGGPRRIRIEREPGTRQLRITGQLPAKDAGAAQLLAIEDPALYAAFAFRDALERRGVAIRGGAAVRHADEPAAGVELARHDSAPLLDALRNLTKISQNLHAELILRAAGKAATGVGTREAGLQAMRAFLKKAGVSGDEFQFNDGSGLARSNLVTPAAVVRLLQYMYASKIHEDWLSLLPVGGEDGTLRLRMRKTSAAGKIRAKTGGLAHVNALSGYAERKDGTMLAFSFLANNESATGAEVRKVLDRICVLMTE